VTDVDDAGDEEEVSTMPLFLVILACVEIEIFDVLIGIRVILYLNYSECYSVVDIVSVSDRCHAVPALPNKVVQGKINKALDSLILSGMSNSTNNS
jgi:hypothetical protein